jgi:biopolymer transport protein ExbD
VAVKFKRRRKVDDEISFASTSDIAFLLLIFFMVSTIFNVEQGLPMQLPGQASETARVPQKNLLKILVASNNLVTLDDQVFPVPAIEGEIRRRLVENPNLVIQVEMHPEAFYGTMVDVLDELHLAEAKKISIKGMEVVQ